MNPTVSATDSQVAGTAEVGEAIRLGMIARRILESVVKNKYRADPAKYAAWISASHIEKPPRSAKPLVLIK